MEDRKGHERLRSFRHRVPSNLNEVLTGLAERGGGKVATDWWVPYVDAPEFLGGWRRRIVEAGLKAVMFGHIGNGHPHVNFLSDSPDAHRRARVLVREMCREAVARGGGVAGEHGLGKIKRDLLGLQHSAECVEEMRDIKGGWDSRWILGRGNLFPAETSPRSDEVRD
jgi:FAD/FMN-containing dehydrogenase